MVVTLELYTIISLGYIPKISALTALSSLNFLPFDQNPDSFSSSPTAGSFHPLAARLMAGMKRAAVCRTRRR